MLGQEGALEITLVLSVVWYYFELPIQMVKLSNFKESVLTIYLNFK